MTDARATQWFLSMCNRGQFAGAAIVEAATPDAAVQRAHELGILTGTESFCLEIPAAGPQPKPEYVDRLLTRADLDNAFDGAVKIALVEVIEVPAAAYGSIRRARTASRN